jgi:hypothetical protein
MKNILFFSAVTIILSTMSCEKDTETKVDSNQTENELLDKSEAHFSLKSGQTIYADKSGNKYYNFNFNPDTLERIYSVYFEEGKKYYLTVSGENAYPINMYLLTSNKDTLFYGETVDIPIMKKYIVWESTVTDTMFVDLAYSEEINFHTYNYQLTFEELTIHTIQWNNLTLECSGDWFVNSDNILTLICYNSSYIKWARIVDNSLFNFDFSYKVSLKSGIPDIYSGIAFYGSKELQEMFNIPIGCYEFKVIGPMSWETWVWSDGGMGRYWGEIPTSLLRGENSWNELKVKTFNDNFELSINSEIVDSAKNVHFMDNGLYITIEDSKADTIFFKDITLIK